MKPKAMKATHDGDLQIGKITIPCAVLEDGTRVLTQRGFLRAIGRSEKGYSQIEGGARKLPAFLTGKGIIDYIDKDLSAPMEPVVFIPKHGGTAFGYRAELLPVVCDVYLKARLEGALPKRYELTAKMCEIIVRGLARVGIIALVDEATGYQQIRDRKALEQILDKYIGKELAAWAKTFPDEFYQQIFRLRGWEWQGMKINRPSCVGTITKDVVYKRLAPGVLAELEKLNPRKDEHGRRYKHHQYLTRDVGHPALKDHLSGVIALMRASRSWDEFIRALKRAFPQSGDQLEFNLEAQQ